MSERDEYIQKVRRSIQRAIDAGDRGAIWADFDVTKQHKTWIDEAFGSLYIIESRACHQCKGYDIIIYWKQVNKQQ